LFWALLSLRVMDLDEISSSKKKLSTHSRSLHLST
jgi:hypothetical protein